MTTALASVTSFVLLLTITAYSVAGGVDYGAGIWDLLAGRGSRADRARELIDHASHADQHSPFRIIHDASPGEEQDGATYSEADEEHRAD